MRSLFLGGARPGDSLGLTPRVSAPYIRLSPLKHVDLMTEPVLPSPARPPRPFAAAAVAVLFAFTAEAAQVSTGVDDQAGLPYWELTDANMSLRLVQRLPDQTRGFFMARGFDAAQTEVIARHCVFQTVFRNTSHGAESSPLTYDLREWTIQRNGQRAALKTREDWREVWKDSKAGRAARIALEWALLPTRQRYQPGDYNWGMSVFGVPPGEVVDLTVRWHQHGDMHSATIEEIQCAPDVPSQPAPP